MSCPLLCHVLRQLLEAVLSTMHILQHMRCILLAGMMYIVFRVELLRCPTRGTEIPC